MQELTPDAGADGGAGQAEDDTASSRCLGPGGFVERGTGQNCGETAKLEGAKKGALLGIVLATSVWWECPQ